MPTAHGRPQAASCSAAGIAERFQRGSKHRGWPSRVGAGSRQCWYGQRGLAGIERCAQTLAGGSRSPLAVCDGVTQLFPLPSWAPPVSLPPSRAIPRALPVSLLIAACIPGCQPASAPCSPLQSANEAPAAGTCRSLVCLRRRCRNLCELSRWLPKRGLVSTLPLARPGRMRGRCRGLGRALAPR